MPSTNLVTFLAGFFPGTAFAQFLHLWEPLVFSFIVILILSAIVILASRKVSSVPGRLQAVIELYVGMVDDFVTGVIGPKGRKFTPFIGTLFIYILFMNLFGLIPFMESPTASWSTTLALALCVFAYVQYAAIRELGIRGYVDHLLGNPRGVVAFSVVIPILLFIIHIVSELVKPISLSLRLRSNIWGDEMLFKLFAALGAKGVPLLFFNTILGMIASLVQAMVFCLLTTIYFSLYLTGEEH